MEYRHKELQDVTNGILLEIHDERMKEVPFRRGGVNWADLRCSDVQFVVDMDGQEYYRFYVYRFCPYPHPNPIRTATLAAFALYRQRPYCDPPEFKIEAFYRFAAKFGDGGAVAAFFGAQCLNQTHDYPGILGLHKE